MSETTVTTPDLVLERREETNRTANVGRVSISPAVSEDYWSYRVRLTEGQAVVGFPKYSTIGIGFAVEEDWNTNLPYTIDTDEIRKHIWHNRGDKAIKKPVVREAIRLIQEAAKADRAATS